MKTKYMFVVVLTVLAMLLSACGGGAQPTEAPSTGSSDPGTAPDAPATEASPADAPVVHAGWAGSPDTLNPGTAVLA